jgi:hypothetical protein
MVELYQGFSISSSRDRKLNFCSESNKLHIHVKGNYLKSVQTSRRPGIYMLTDHSCFFA